MKPFKFCPILKSVLWGGSKLAPYKGLISDRDDIGESWEISGIAGRESVVAEGEDAGLTLTQIIEKYDKALIGSISKARYGKTFPLLIKFIHSQKDLSLQVHPNDVLALKRHNSMGKTEMWYVIDCEPESVIYAGLSKVISPADYDRHIANDTFMDVVACHKSHPGDLFFLPAGRIHAIGAGNLLLEVQRTSDITYRIYDYNRLDANGNPRELHAEEAKYAIDYTVSDNYISTPSTEADGVSDLVKCDYFDVKRVKIDGTKEIDITNFDSFVAMMCIEGNNTITDNNNNITTLKQGETILIPAATTHLTITGKSTIITATI
ncbi:MAG: class I mannose-6-phosphate isomerase [Muribaculaceae bacterium]|nr:class I mannose-6-phosphate isomerase [Muribaculaceae bacterium]